MSTIVLIRPGFTDFDDQQRIQGLLDIPLNARGLTRARQTADDLSRHQPPIDVLYASPCTAARQTAEVIGQRLDVPVKILEGLYNVSQGLWEGLPVDEIRRKHPKVFKQWQECPETVCPPHGEMLTDAACRVRKALSRPLRKALSLGLIVPEPLASVVRSVILQKPIRSSLDEGAALAPESAGDHPQWEVLDELISPKSNWGLFRRFALPALAAVFPAGRNSSGEADEFRRQALREVH